MNCAASISRAEALPDEPQSGVAWWGTVCHAILERALLRQIHPMDVDVTGIEGILDFDLEEQDEMRRTAAVAYDYAILEGSVVAESPSNPGVLIVRDDCWGTVDITILSHGRLEIVDLKSGKGVLCHPDDPQLKLYALGKLGEHYPGVPENVPDIDVVLTIVQPRYPGEDPIRSTTISAEQLITWGLQEVRAAAARTDAPDAPAHPGDHCREGFCRARYTCPELASAAMSAAQGVFTPVPVPEKDDTLAQRLTMDPATLSEDQIRFILRHMDLIEGWLTSVRRYALSHPTKGYKVVAGRSMRKWKVSDSDIVRYLTELSTKDGEKVSEDMITVKKLLSPAQAEKRLRPNMDVNTWGKVHALITKPPGAPTLAPETDPRPALGNAAEVFSPYETEN